jgi:proteasome lid subunit RPN8/RPN11
MSMQQYRYAIELYRGERELIEQATASVDWDPALEWAWLQGIRKGLLQLTDGTSSSAIRPLWHPDAGEPYVAGFRVTILAEHAAGVSEDFTTDYFKEIANASTRRLIDEGRLQSRDGVRFVALAYFSEDHTQTGPASPFRTTEVAPDLTLGESMLADSLAASTPAPGSADVADPDDVPIFIPRRVLDETREAARRAGDRETGGILIGHLHRDTEASELFVEITAQIPVAHAPAEVNKLTFTPETWTAAQNAVDLRRSDEIFQGWWHSHPVREWCKNCPQERKDVCPLALGFLSSDDCQLHRTVFPKAYTCALVVSDIAEDRDVVHTLFGWRRGAIERRGYRVTGDAPSSGQNDRTRSECDPTSNCIPESRGGNP